MCRRHCGKKKGFSLLLKGTPMIQVTITPNAEPNLYGALIGKERDLRRHKKGTLHRHGAKKKNEEKWVHISYPGWVRFQKCLGGVIVAQVGSRNEDAEWQLLSSFIGFLDRHFREDILTIAISYD